MTAVEVDVDDVAAVIADPEIGTRVYRIRPGDLELALNARGTPPPDPDLEASIAARGVLQPVIAYVADGALQVEMGQRRAISAHRVGRPWVPVVLVDPPAQTDRIVDQLTENHHRAPIPTADEAAALSQLVLYGMSVAEVSTALSRPARDVAAAVKVAASPVAVAAAAAAPVDLEQAAAIADVADVASPTEVETLVAAARESRGAFEHVHQQLLDAARDREESARVLAELRAAGVVALERPDWTKVSPLDSLGITPAKHRKCPGHAGFAQQRRTVDGGRWVYGWAAAYVCTEPKRHRPDTAAAATLDDEAARAARAEVLDGNRQWRTAETVRRRWLREFAHRGRPPFDVEEFIAAALLRGDDCLRRAFESRHQLLRDLLAVEGSDAPPARSEVEQLVGRLPGYTRRRAITLAAAVLLAAWEATTDVHCWRDRIPSAGHELGGWRGVDRFYMGWLVRFGYEPAPIERRLLIDERPPAAAAAEPAAATSPGES